MRSYLTIRNLTAAVSATIAAGLVLSGVAYAISSTAFTYSTPKTGYLMIPAAAFTPESDTVTFTNTGGTLRSADGVACFNAPVNLPHAASITGLAMWYRKNDDNLALLRIIRAEPSKNIEMIAAQLDPANSGGNYTSTSVEVDPSEPNVSNVRHMYFLVNCLSASETFLSARIKYTYSSAGD